MNPIRASISGELASFCQLGDFPIVRTFLSIPQELEDYSFHTCAIDSESSLLKEKILEFVPPNGKTIVFTYAIANQQPVLPFEI